MSTPQGLKIRKIFLSILYIYTPSPVSHAYPRTEYLYNFFFQPEACGKNVTVKLFLHITKHLCNVAIMQHYFANLLDSCINVTPGYFYKYWEWFSQCCINITFITIIEMLRSFSWHVAARPHVTFLQHCCNITTH